MDAGRLRRSTATVGLAFDVQIIDMVPADERDMSVDIVVTDRRVTHAARTRSRPREGPVVLPSQTAPTVRRRAAAPRRRRHRRAPAVIAALLVLPAVLLGIKILLPGEKTPAPEPAGVVTAIPEPAVASAPDITAEAEPQQAGPRAAVPEAPAPVAVPQQTSQPPLAGLAAASRQRAREQMGAGLSLAETNHPVDARRALTAALVSGALDAADAEFARDRLGAINRRLVFSPEV
ncbi:MAG: hypothetical protein ACYSUA_18070, partial [Planctomycetota bacterium]